MSVSLICNNVGILLDLNLAKKDNTECLKTGLLLFWISNVITFWDLTKSLFFRLFWNFKSGFQTFFYFLIHISVAIWNPHHSAIRHTFSIWFERFKNPGHFISALDLWDQNCFSLTCFRNVQCSNEDDLALSRSFSLRF